MQTIDNLSGESIKGYELRQLLGAGSFGAVYVAFHAPVKREVAMKVILPQYANHPEFIRRFELEAQLVARLEYPYIVPLYDYWREPDSAFLIMRLLRGGNLREVVTKGPMPLPDIARILDQVASALTVAHQQGVVHRDIKPANVLLDMQGNAYLADFGIAKDLQVAAVESTVAGSIVGSPAYLSPEQVQSLPVTPQSDIYSLGIVLYEMLAGERPYPDANLSTLLLHHINDNLPNIRIRRPELPEEVNRVILRATMKNPEHRYPNAVTLAAAFRHAIGKRHEATGDILPRSSQGVEVSSLLSMGEPSPLPSSIDIELPEPENPYKGLRPFHEADALDFFGRKGLTDHLISRLLESHPLNRFLAVVGPSGSGKSSVVKAGLVPAIRHNAIPGGRKWFIVEMVPGSHPFEELEAALLRVAVNPPASLLTQLTEDELGLFRAVKRVLPDDPEIELLLVIDQFEEVFTLVEDEERRKKFLTALIKAVSEPRSRLRLIVTLRADFYDRPLMYQEIGEVIRQRTEVVLPLSEQELEEAIIGPAMRVGVSYEEGLATDIAVSVGEQPGALPLLQYALTELFQRREGLRLTRKAYADTGGVSGALARRAEELYSEMTPAQQNAARQLFLRLVTLGEGTEDTRRRVQQRELNALGMDAKALDDVTNVLGKFRLLTFDHDPNTREPTIEVAHEALIRKWDRLRDWVNDRREQLRLQRRLTNAAQEWMVAGRDFSFLASGTRLAQIEEALTNSDLALTDVETAYLSASILQRETEERREQERQNHERALEARSRQFLRALVGALSLGLVIAAILSLVAAWQWSTAQNNADEAQEQKEIAEENALQAEENANKAQSLVLTANARNQLSANNPNLALALAIESVGTTPLPEVQRTLSTMAYAPGVRWRLEGHTAAVMDVAVNADHTLAVSGDASGVIIVWDLQTGQELRRLAGHTDSVNSVAINGSYALSGSTDKLMILWDIETGEEIRRFEGHTERINAVAFSPDGTVAASAAGLFGSNDSPTDATIRLWEVETGEQVRVLTGHTGGVLTIDFSADGRYLVSGSGTQDRTLRVWDTTAEDDPNTADIDEAEVFRTANLGGFVRAVAFSPDGLTVASGTYSSATSGLVRLWDAQTGAELRRFYGHTDVMTGVDYAPNGKTLISTSWDRTVRVWNIDTAVEVQRFAAHNDNILAMVVSEDGRYVLTATGNTGTTPQDTSVRMWDLQGTAEALRLTGHTDWIWDVAYSPDGTLAATAGGSLFTTEGDNSVRIWDTTTGMLLNTLTGPTNVIHSVAFSPDGKTLVSGSWDRTVQVWDVASGEQVRVLEGHEDQVLHVEYSPDGQYILSSGGNPRATSNDNSIRVWDAATGDLLYTLTGHEKAINVAIFTPLGILSGSEDTTIRLWNMETGAEIRQFSGHTSGVVSLALSPDGTKFLSGGKDSSLRLWDLASGEQLHQFVGHNGQVLGTAFSPDGTLALSGGSDTNVIIWDVITGEEIRRYPDHTDWVVSVAFSPDGFHALSGSDDLTARIWRVDRTVEDLIGWANQTRYIPTLTCAQKDQYNIQDAECES